MNQPDKTQPLDSFESSLLTELKAEVALHAEALSAEALPAVRRPRRRRALGISLGGVVAAGVTALGISSLTATPAWSVSERNGEVTVEVNRLEGAANLEDELAKHGVTADITFLDPNMKCSEERTDDSLSTRGVSLEYGQERFVVHLPAGTLKAGQTFVLSASIQEFEDRSGQAWVSYGLADGPVAPCLPVTNPAW